MKINGNFYLGRRSCSKTYYVSMDKHYRQIALMNCNVRRRKRLFCVRLLWNNEIFRGIPLTSNIFIHICRLYSSCLMKWPQMYSISWVHTAYVLFEGTAAYIMGVLYCNILYWSDACNILTYNGHINVNVHNMQIFSIRGIAGQVVNMGK